MSSCWAITWPHCLMHLPVVPMGETICFVSAIRINPYYSTTPCAKGSRRPSCNLSVVTKYGVITQASLQGFPSPHPNPAHLLWIPTASRAAAPKRASTNRCHTGSEAGLPPRCPRPCQRRTLLPRPIPSIGWPGRGQQWGHIFPQVRRVRVKGGH